MTRTRRFRPAALVAAALLIGTLIYAPEAQAAPVQISWFVASHPDDEFSSWSLITGSTGNYKVMIYSTRGEQTGSCMTASEAGGANGPYQYQGPLSPVAQPDYGEINPMGAGYDIWSGGRWTSTCAEARMSGLLGFLDDKAASDPAIPSGFTQRADYSNTTSPCQTNTVEGVPPQRIDGTAPYEVTTTAREIRVYDASNGMGKVIFFNLGDGDLKMQEVKWAVDCVRANKLLFGIPTTLPDVNAIGPFFNDRYTSCQSYPHTDHNAVHDALWNYDMVNGKQWGRSCASDPDTATTAGGRTNTLTATEHANTIAGSTTTRTGPLQRRYGWLIQGYWDSNWTCATCINSQSQSFWGRFS